MRRAPCSYYGTPRGCRNGDSCRFLHEGAPGGSSQSHGPGRGRGTGRGVAAASTFRDPPGSSRPAYGAGSSARTSAAKQLLAQLGSCLDPPPDVVQRWAHLALQQCERGQAGYILEDLRSPDGVCFLRAAALQMIQPEASTQLVAVLVPLLKVLTHEQVKLDPTLANPVLSSMHDILSLSALSTALKALSTAGGANESFIRYLVQGIMLLPCQPKDWLDVLQPIATYLQEVTTRFSATLQQTSTTLEGAQSLLTALAEAFSTHLPASSTIARSKAAEVRRLLTSLQLLERQLQAHQGKSESIAQLHAAQEQFAAQQKKQAAPAAAPGTPGPGLLHPKGPRHDNDVVDHLEISVAPTRDEVLCTERPFLPSNRPGSLPHAAHDPDRAHRELHFRLLRHDVVGPVCDAAKAFREFGGVAGLKTLKSQTAGCSVRLHLKAGRDVQDMYVFRNVSILGLTSTFNGGIAYMIEFDDAPQLASATQPRRHEWWKHTKQLQHGSLVALWWDGDDSSNTRAAGSQGTQGALPNVMFATVCERDVDKLLAPRGERRRPQLGIRMCGQSVTSELMAAVLGRQRLGGKKEVVLLPAAGSFFAYEPILKALQSKHPLPLARYILYDQSTDDSSSSSSTARRMPVLLHGELVGGGRASTGGAIVEVPAYAAGADCVYDFTAVMSPDKVKNLSTADLQRLQRMLISGPGGIPLDLLLRATSLDESQAAALAACLTRELSVVQGPPGCGKTYIGVQLVRLVLANTRSSPASLQLDEVKSSIPLSQRPGIGPILVLCFTNHALDAFLLDLVNCGITEGIIRVGRRSNCPELEQYNLRNQEGGQARGREVGKCRARVEELKELVNDKLIRLKHSKTARRLQWSDAQYWLQHKYPALADSFDVRGSIMEQAAFLEAATADQRDGFQQARGRKNRRKQQQLGWVWGIDTLQDWISSSPVQDWQRDQWMQHSAQHWEEEAARGLHGDAAAADDSWTDRNAAACPSAGPYNGQGSYASSSHGGSSDIAGFGANSSRNLFAAFSAETGDTDGFSAFLAQLQAAPATGTHSSSGSLLSQQRTDTVFSDWLLLGQTQGASAAADSDSEGDGWEVASLSSISSDVPPASPKATAVQSPACGTATQTQQAPQAAATAAISRTSAGTQQPGRTAGRGAAQEGLVDTAQEGDTGAPGEVLLLEAMNRPVEDLLLLEDVHSMSKPERVRLYQHMAHTLATEWGSDISSLVSELESEQQKLKALYDRASLQVLSEARIVGMTTTGLANQQGLLHGLQPKVVIVEEAAEVLEAHILTSLAPTVEHLVLIGDHFQLSPKVEVYELQKESGKGYDLNKSMFERLVETGAVQHVTLLLQRRMRPEISELIRAPLYPELKDHPVVTTYPHVKGMMRDLFFWDHNEKEGGTDQSKSRFNDHEVQACIGLARYLLQQGYGGSDQPDICILTPYVGQLLRLRKAIADVSDVKFVMSDRDATDLNRVVTDAAMADGPFDSAEFDFNSSSGGGSSNGTEGMPLQLTSSDAAGALAGAGSKVVTMGRSIRLATIDNFQGEEAKIIILSLVRNPREANAGIGFLAVDNRINVLLSRAKEGMYLVGTSAALSAAADKAIAAGRSCMWASVVEHLTAQGCLGKTLQVCCQRHGKITDINQPRDFNDLVGDGGCQQACGLKLPCGHTCPRRCHADDPRHTQTKCLKPCGKMCARERHACNRLCFEPCSACTVLEESVNLPCGHTARNVPCFKAGEPDKIRCSQLVTVTYPGCSHELQVPCCSSAGYRAGTEFCTHLVQVTLPGCGHTVTMPCSKAALAMLDPTCCTEKCGGLVSGCEHTCTSTCGRCMQLLLQGAVSSGSSSSSSKNAEGNTSTAGDGSVPKGLVEVFLDKLQGHPGLLDVWTEWHGKNAAAVKQAKLGQLWLRFVKSEMSAGLGTKQCKMLGAAVSSSSSSPASTWDDYVSSFERMGMVPSSAIERLAALWQCALLKPTQLSSSSSTTSAALRPHMPCSKVCDRPLACGHSCEQKCHHSSSCGPCRKPCGIACQHTKCDHACAQPCAPCAEPCEWFCEHKGACLLPCGVPCDREPCNVRCSKLLSCGHRCPGLCGEVCLPRKFCVDPACMAKAPQHVKDRVVDMLLFKTFGDLTDADVSADPLILLSCGHLFSASTLDGHMAMSEAYERKPSNSSSSRTVPNSSNTADGHTASTDPASDLDPWGSPLHRSDFPQPKHCPDCRVLITSVRRYGRVIMHNQLGVSQRKYAEAIRTQLSGSRARLKQLQDTVLSPSAPWRDNTSLAAADRLIYRKSPLAAGLLRELGNGAAAAFDTGDYFRKLAGYAKQTPKVTILDRTQAAIKQAEQTNRLAKDVAQSRVVALLKVPIKVDLQLSFQAVQGQATAAQLWLTLAAHQLEALDAGLKACNEALTRESVSEGLSTDYNPRFGDSSRGSGRGGTGGWLAGQFRDLQQQVKRITGSANQLFYRTSQSVQWATTAAATDGNMTASYRASHSLMLLLVERASQLQVLKQASLASVLARSNSQGRRNSAAEPSTDARVSEQIQRQQLDLLQQAEAVGQKAQQLYAAQKRQWMENADSAEQRDAFMTMQHDAIEAVRGLLQKLPEIKANFAGQMDASEVAAVLAVLMKAEGEYYSNLGLQGFMNGHLYECPNGHLFVIGNCGQAMQASRCNVCGARIGGGSHQLDPNNRQASAAVRSAVAAAAAGGADYLS